jgi:hypothetical protein
MGSCAFGWSGRPLAFGLRAGDFDSAVEPLRPGAAGVAIGEVLASSAGDVALQIVPYWWQAQHPEFREYSRPQSVNWPPLWDHGGGLRGGLGD